MLTCEMTKTQISIWMENLSGKGGRLDDPYVRSKMMELMSSYHPSVLNSYVKGRYHDLPQDAHYHPAPKTKRREDPGATVVDMGGSLSALTHSENGLLRSHDSRFYPHFEIV